MTNLEQFAYDVLARNGWTLDQQYKVLDYTLDFAEPDLKVGIEIDGWFHRQEKRALRDYLRDNRLRANGWVIFRVSFEYGEPSVQLQLLRIVEVLNAFAQTRPSREWSSAT